MSQKFAKNAAGALYANAGLQQLFVTLGDAATYDLLHITSMQHPNAKKADAGVYLENVALHRSQVVAIRKLGKEGWTEEETAAKANGYTHVVYFNKSGKFDNSELVIEGIDTITAIKADDTILVGSFAVKIAGDGEDYGVVIVPDSRNIYLDDESPAVFLDGCDANGTEAGGVEPEPEPEPVKPAKGAKGGKGAKAVEAEAEEAPAKPAKGGKGAKPAAVEEDAEEAPAKPAKGGKGAAAPARQAAAAEDDGTW